MKRIISVLALLVPPFLCAYGQKPFTVSGQLTGLREPVKIMLIRSSADGDLKDSVVTANGKFTFRGKISHPVQARLTLQSVSAKEDPTIPFFMQAADEQQLFLDEGTTTVMGNKSMKAAVIKGGPTQQEYQQLRAQLKPLEERSAPLKEKITQYFREKNKSAREELYPKMQAIGRGMESIRTAYIWQHPDSYVSLAMIMDGQSLIEYKSFEESLDILSDRIKNSSTVKRIRERIAMVKSTDAGQPAIEFTQNDTSGVPVSLRDFRGKYVLVDFWASWCAPCRDENPNLVKAYNRFKDRNFEIIGISLDHNKEAWKKAIKKDGLPWIHVSDLLGWKNAAVKAYHVDGVPLNFLIDPDGKIIARNLRGETLSKSLEELIKN